MAVILRKVFVKWIVSSILPTMNNQKIKKEEIVLDVDNLSVDFSIDGKWLPVVNNFSFSLSKGEILAIVGESGCGKSVTCLSLAKLVDESVGRYSSGSVTLFSEGEKHDILSMPSKKLRKIRGKKIAYIFQEPSTSLNPVFKVGDQVAEAIISSRGNIDNIEQEVISLFELVGITDPAQRIYSYPHELSGGMQQRVMIAMALAGKPDILVA